MRLLVTTNPGLERVAVEEVADLLSVGAERTYRGAVAVERAADPEAVARLHRYGRSVHRVLSILRDATVDDLDDVYDHTVTTSVEAYLGPDRSFAVRSTRHGEHDFTSVDVADRAGQAVVDRVREAVGTRPPVDLDDPDVILRAFVRDDRYLLCLDLTGASSRHRRSYRVCEHDAPLRPTIAYSLVRLSGYDPATDRLLDPTCGSATIPIEAARFARGTPVEADATPVVEHLQLLGSEGEALDPDPDPGAPPREPTTPRVTGVEKRHKWVRCARVNADAAGVTDALTLREADVTETAVDADVVVGNLPFGIRTPTDLRALYGGLVDRLREGSARRAVFLTTSPELLDLDTETVETVSVRYGRLQAWVVVADL